MGAEWELDLASDPFHQPSELFELLGLASVCSAALRSPSNRCRNRKKKPQKQAKSPHTAPQEFSKNASVPPK
jgi:hypothetical protein